MVLFLYPYGHVGAEKLGMALYATRTLHALLPVNDRKAAVKSVLATDITVVIPDDYAPNPEWSDVLLALRALKHPVMTVNTYLNSLTSKQPAAGTAAPPTQQRPAVGLTIQQA
jgi:hypothetical protein